MTTAPSAPAPSRSPLTPSSPTSPTSPRTPSSRALATFPAGSNGEFNLPPHLVRVIHRGEGSRLWDAEGRELLDFSMGWGSVLPGHAHPDVVRAVTTRAPLGTNFAFTNTESLALGEELIRLSPACERVRFCASGTEATMYCLRLARAFRNRAGIMKFEGAYHGSNDEGVVSLFPSGTTPFPAPEPSSAGVHHNHIIIAPYNDADAARATIDAHADTLAAVIVEPLHRCLAPRPGFLAALREACTKHGVLLIFDEVVTGFRLAYGGAQEKYGVIPDLVAYGKALGGGLPIGAFGGRADIMDIVREDKAGTDADYVWTASTLGGNPVSCAAANAALAFYRTPGTYDRLHALGEHFRDGLRKALRDTGHTGQVIGDGPLGQIVFSSEPVFDYRSTIKGNRAKARAMMLALFENDIFINPMGTKLYLSLAHDEPACTEFCARLARVLRTI